MNIRADHPDHAAWIDSLRESFGKEGIDASLRAGMQGIPGKFCLRDLAGNVIAGTPAAPARHEFTLAEIVIQRKDDYMETKCTHCGNTSCRHPAGDLCHSCQRGIMVPVKK